MNHGLTRAQVADLLQLTTEQFDSCFSDDDLLSLGAKKIGDEVLVDEDTVALLLNFVLTVRGAP